MQSKNKQVAEKIIDILQDGLMLSADTLHYIDSTFSNPSMGELEQLLLDESSCETDSLIELIFFPDESVQMQLEEIVGDARFQKQDENHIQKMVCARPLQTRIRFADDRGTLLLAVAPLNVAQFIAHLNLSRCPNPKLTAAISDYVPENFQTRCKVRLRNARPVSSPSKISFLQAFFEKLQIETDDFFEYLDFVLGLLDELPEKTDMFAALMAKKRFYFLSLQKARNFDIQLTKHNVETLLLKGKRHVYVDRADMRKKIQMIDRISLAIFEKTDFFDLMPAGEQSIRLDGKQDIDQLIKEFN